MDLGCGPGDARPALESMGFGWVGVDLPPARPTFLADAHSLPFLDGSFSAVFSLAVLEHLHSPFVALKEVHRILAGGAPFVGVAAFGEPFHASFFHLSPWGLVSLLQASGFKVTRIWPCRDALAALADMGGYPWVIRRLLAPLGKLAHVPALTPRRWLRKGKSSDPWAVLTTAGSIGVVARKG